MLTKPKAVRFTKEQERRLEEFTQGGDFTFQELVRIAVDRLIERLDSGEELIVKKVLKLDKREASETGGKRKPRIILTKKNDEKTTSPGKSQVA